MNRKINITILLIFVGVGIKGYFTFVNKSIPYTSKEECEQKTGEQCYLFRGLCQVGEAQNQKEAEENEKYLRECLPKIDTWQPVETTSQPTQTQTTTTTTETTQPSSSDNRSLDEKIATCYPKNEGCSACQPILNNSVQRVVETERRFVNVPKDFYPEEIRSNFTTVSGNASAGWISNGGLPGKGLDSIPECWSTYYEFDGYGEVDLRVKSIKQGIPDYFVRFIVGPTQ